MRTRPRYTRADVIERNHARSGLELQFRVALWFASIRRLPSAEEVISRWGVSKAAAYRWLQAWKDATGEAQ